MRRWSLLLLCVWVWAVCPVVAGAQSPSKIEIDYRDGELSVDMENASLEDVLERIAEQTGMEILINEDVPNTLVSVAFKGWELDRGLKKILGRTNYAFVYGPDRSILTLEIFGKINQDFPDIPVEEPRSEDRNEPPPPQSGDDGRPDDSAETPSPPEEPAENQPVGDAPVVIQDADGNSREAPDSGG